MNRFKLAVVGLSALLLASAAEAEPGYIVRVRIARRILPEGLLTALERSQQRRAIGEAVQRVVARLTGRPKPGDRSFASIPVVFLRGLSESELQVLRADPDVLSLRLQHMGTPSLDDSIPLIGGAGGSFPGDARGIGQVVAVIDTGVASAHPFLAGRVLSGAGACFSDGLDCPGGTAQLVGQGSAEPCTWAYCSHGTHVAGVVAGVRNQGDPGDAPARGVASSARVLPIRIASEVAGSVRFYESDFLSALQYLIDLPAPVRTRIAAVNGSLNFRSVVATDSCDAAWPEAKLAIDNLRSYGMAYVASAGNDGRATESVAPACFTNVVGVAASTKGDAVWALTNTSDGAAAGVTWLFAPGAAVVTSPVGPYPIEASIHGIRSSWFEGGVAYAEQNGTSFAAPHVSGTIALLRERWPALSVNAIENLLTSHGPVISAPPRPPARRLDAAAVLNATTAAPGPPGDVDAHFVGNGVVNVSWSAGDPRGWTITGYRIERITAGSSTFVPAGTVPATQLQFQDDVHTLPSGSAVLYRVKALAGRGTASAGADDVARTAFFTDDPIVPGQTPIRAVHVTELRAAADALTALAAGEAGTWTGAVAAGEAIRAIHLTELRQAISAALERLGLEGPSFEDPVLNPGVPIRAVHFNQVRSALR